MVSAQFLIALVFVPILVTSYKCTHTDTSNRVDNSECTSSSYCVTYNEFNDEGVWVKEIKDCADTGRHCQANGKYSVYYTDSKYITIYDCCTGDFCNSNSATNKGLLALPVMILTYVFFK